jgi:hypothetical protein
MSGTSRGARAPARTTLLALAFALAVAALISAFSAMPMNPLEAESDSVLPVPKNISSTLFTGVGVDNAPYRHELKRAYPPASIRYWPSIAPNSASADGRRPPSTP